MSELKSSSSKLTSSSSKLKSSSSLAVDGAVLARDSAPGDARVRRTPSPLLPLLRRHLGGRSAQRKNVNDTVNSTKRFPRKFTSVSTSASSGTSALPGPTPAVPVRLDAGTRDEEVDTIFKTALHPIKAPAAASASTHMLLPISPCMMFMPVTQGTKFVNSRLFRDCALLNWRVLFWTVPPLARKARSARQPVTGAFIDLNRFSLQQIVSNMDLGFFFWYLRDQGAFL